VEYPNRKARPGAALAADGDIPALVSVVDEILSVQNM
jgi:hypothetical protein